MLALSIIIITFFQAFYFIEFEEGYLFMDAIKLTFFIAFCVIIFYLALKSGENLPAS